MKCNFITQLDKLNNNEITLNNDEEAKKLMDETLSEIKKNK